MKITWGKNAKMKRQPVLVSTKPGLPFGVDSDTDEADKEEKAGASTNCPGTKPLDTAESLQRQGDKLAEEGKYHEALSRWEAALTLAPDNAILHEQKAQVLLEVGDAWHALTAATRATELDPLWPEAWVTLGRAQLNFGEPDSAILSFDKALVIKVFPFWCCAEIAVSASISHHMRATHFCLTDLLDALHSTTMMVRKLTVKLQSVLSRNEGSCTHQV